MSIIQFPNPPSARDASEDGASPVSSQPQLPTAGEASIRFGVGADYAGETAAAPPPRQPTPNPIQLLCKTLERAALTKEQRFRAWLGQNPVMERNPYARQWFENAEAAYDHNQWKDYQEERDGDYYR